MKKNAFIILTIFAVFASVSFISAADFHSDVCNNDTSLMDENEFSGTDENVDLNCTDSDEKCLKFISRTAGDTDDSDCIKPNKNHLIADENINWNEGDTNPLIIKLVDDDNNPNPNQKLKLAIGFVEHTSFEANTDNNGEVKVYFYLPNDVTNMEKITWDDGVAYVDGSNVYTALNVDKIDVVSAHNYDEGSKGDVWCQIYTYQH